MPSSLIKKEELAPRAFTATVVSGDMTKLPNAPLAGSLIPSRYSGPVVFDSSAFFWGVPCVGVGVGAGVGVGVAVGVDAGLAVGVGVTMGVG